jgi:hypothetical protein
MAGRECNDTSALDYMRRGGGQLLSAVQVGGVMSERVRHVLILVLFLLGPSFTAFAEIVGGSSWTRWPGGRWQPDTPSYGIQCVTGVPIVMDDGVTLFADIGYPTNLATGERATGKFPVLLAQNPYVFTPPPDVFYVARGYIEK